MCMKAMYPNVADGHTHDNVTVDTFPSTRTPKILQSENILVNRRPTHIAVYYLRYQIVNLPNETVSKVLSALKRWQHNTCLSFQRAENLTSGLTFSRAPCAAHNGRFATAWNIRINTGCDSERNLVHLTGHYLGFYDEQRMPSRGKYIEFLNAGRTLSLTTGSIMAKLMKAEEKQISHYRTFNDNNTNDYDITSVMHMEPRSFDKGDKALFQTKDYKLRGLLGRFSQTSHRDQHHFNERFHCFNNWLRACRLTENPCLNEGFLNGHCKCVCPDDRTGILCEKEKENPPSYDSPCAQRVTSDGAVISSYDFRKVDYRQSWCSYEIEAPEHYYVKIEFTFEEVIDPGYEGSRCKGSLLSIVETKLKGSQERVFCGEELLKNISYKSVTNEVDVLYDVRNPKVERGFSALVTFHPGPLANTTSRPNPMTTTSITTTTTVTKPTTMTATTATKSPTTTTQLTASTEQLTATTTAQKPTALTMTEPATATTQEVTTRTSTVPPTATVTTEEPLATDETGPPPATNPATTAEPATETSSDKTGGSRPTVASGSHGTSRHGHDAAAHVVCIWVHVASLFIAGLLNHD
ncbi:protein SpAN-like isoform X2 [Macrobrachium rosenbergii]|uniref:protein SpAN-like isoform X2 n=1 Tax=Macrobrachium rosenbergii TaxID=79674 RepID=UPI0034D6EA19